jgi:polysaccharide export outer membrane protein
MPLRRKITASTIRRLTAGGILAACSFGWTSSAALSDQITPQTKLRVTVIQWMPTKGTYERWEALGGEFEVSQGGDLVLPVIGSVPTGNLDHTALAAEIAKRLQEKLVLVDKPDTTVEILDYPPVYVLGTVKTPGEYKYRPGMTVLQALALGGGLPKADEEQSQKEIQLVSELQTIDTDILRCMAKIARLTAESEGAAEIRFPIASASDEAVKQIFAREKVIFTTRANELDRQTKSLADLRNLLNAEIDVLTEKIKAADASIASAETELGNVTMLVEKGIAVASRKSELERSLSGYRTDRLDQVTAVMRARQAITEATRNADGLLDRQKTEVATALQDEQAKLATLKLKRDAWQKILLKTLAAKPAGAQQDRGLSFTITRRQKGNPVEISASETTALLPGDVITVASAVAAPGDAVRPVAAQDTKTQAASEKPSQ